MEKHPHYKFVNPNRTKIRIILVTLILVIIGFFYLVKESNNKQFNYSQNSEQQLPAKDEAWVVSHGFVKQYLKSPASASFPMENVAVTNYGSKYIVNAFVDAQNSFGALLRENYVVVMIFKGGEWGDPNNWVLKEVAIDGKDAFLAN